MKNKKFSAMAFRTISATAILLFALFQTKWGIKNNEILLAIIGAIVAIMFSQYTLLNFLYWSSYCIREEGADTYRMKIGNLEIAGKIEEIQLTKLGKRHQFYIFKNTEVRLLKYPLMAKFLLKNRTIFQFSFWAFHNLPVFFRSEEDLNKFYEYNESLFGEKIVLSSELIDACGSTFPAQDHIL